ACVLADRLKPAVPEGRAARKLGNPPRPPFVEADAVQRAAYIAHTAGAPLYVVHTSSDAAVEVELLLWRAGAKVHIEPCPHYLTHDIGWAGGDIGKINPPLRVASDRERLWRGLGGGGKDNAAHHHLHP